MSFKCEFCSGIFSAKSSLTLHQKRAKYCLSNRGIEKEIKYTCDMCDKKFNEKRYMEKHREKCNLPEQLRKKDTMILDLTKNLIKATQQNKDYESTLEKLEKQISELQSKLENIAIQGVKKSTTTNILKLQPLTKEWLDAQAMLLTDNHLSQGMIGLAQFAADNSFKDRVVCTDANRKSLKYKEGDGKVSKDPKGKKLSKMFFESIKSKADNILPEMIEKIKQELDDAGEEPSVFDIISGKMTELINVEKGIKQISKGQETQLKEEFTKQLCELLPNP